MAIRISAILLAVILCFVAFTGCGKKPEPACTFVLFDLSVGKTARDLYSREFAKVVNLLGPGDAVFAEKITDQTEQTSTLPISAEIPQFNGFSDNEVVYKGQVATIRKKLNETANSLLAEKAPNTDIMSGFRLASKILKGEKGKKYTIQKLIVFTDGIEQNSSYEFTKKDELLGNRVEEIIKAEKLAGRISDLSGIEVYMVGVNLDPDPAAGITREKMARLQKFWIDYTKACGGNLDQTNYGSTLSNFVMH